MDYTTRVDRTVVTKHTDNLICEGDRTFETTTKKDFQDTEVTYTRPRKRTWTKDDVNKYYETIEEVTTTETHDTFKTVEDINRERLTPFRPSDNLKPEGEFYTPEKPGFKPAESPKQVWSDM